MGTTTEDEKHAALRRADALVRGIPQRLGAISPLGVLLVDLLIEIVEREERLCGHLQATGDDLLQLLATCDDQVLRRVVVALIERDRDRERPRAEASAELAASATERPSRPRDRWDEAIDRALAKTEPAPERPRADLQVMDGGLVDDLDLCACGRPLEPGHTHDGDF